MGIIERKEKEKEIRKNDIIDAAEKLFFKKGYFATTMDEISNMAEFSKRTVYIYFSSKEQIYFEIMVRGYKILIGMLKKDIENEKEMNSLDKLHQIGRTFYKFSNEYTDYFKTIMEYENSEIDFEKGMPDKSREECYALGEKVFNELTLILKSGVEEGVFRKELDVVETAIYLWSCIMGIFNTLNNKRNYITHYHKKNVEELLPKAFDVLIRSIQIEKGGILK